MKIPFIGHGFPCNYFQESTSADPFDEIDFILAFCFRLWETHVPVGNSSGKILPDTAIPLFVGRFVG
jgi:hypothetical protein